MMLPGSKITILALTAWLIFSCLYNPAICSQASRHSEALPVKDLHINADLLLHWSDLLSRPGHSAPDRKDSSDLNSVQLSEHYDSEPARSPGLSYLRIISTLSLFESSSLKLSFRPDALIARDPKTKAAKEHDTRAGVVYTSYDDPDFLESYDISGKFTPLTGWNLGTISGLLSPKTSYRSPLDFGLIVIFPRNIFRAALHWATDYEKNLFDTSDSITNDFEFFVYQGPSDKSDMISASERSFDSGIVSKDPYYGLGLKTELSSGHDWSLGFMLGYHEAGYSAQQQKSVYSDLRFEHQLLTGLLVHHISWNLRLFKDNWVDPGQSISSLSQLSFSLTDKVSLSPNNSILTGLYIGRSEHQNEDNVQEKHSYYGHQIEFGWEHRIHKGLSFKLLVAEEHRQLIDSDGNMEAGFKKASGSQKMLRRIGATVKFTI